jgi:hypothetical protein
MRRFGAPSKRFGEKRRHPAHGVAGKEEQVHARVPHLLHAVILADVPVLVVADADEGFALQTVIWRDHVALEQ